MFVCVVEWCKRICLQAPIASVAACLVSYWLSERPKRRGSTKVSPESVIVAVRACMGFVCPVCMFACFTRSIPSSDFTTIRLNQASYGFCLTQLSCGANLIFLFFVCGCMSVDVYFSCCFCKYIDI